MRISDWSSDVCSSDLCAICPFIRLFDDGFTLDDIRKTTVELLVEGPEGYRLEGTNAMAEISRDPADLVRQTMSEHHFPDGFALFCGTLFAPTQDPAQQIGRVACRARVGKQVE